MGIGRKFVTFAAVVGVMVVGGGFATALDNDSHTVTFTVTATRTLTLSNTNVGAAYGNIAIGVTDDTESGGDVQYVTDVANDKVYVKYDAGITGATLKVTAGTPSDCDGDPCTGVEGTSSGEVTISTSDQAVLSGIGPITAGTASSGLTYSLSTASGIAAGAKTFTVTYTASA